MHTYTQEDTAVRDSFGEVKRVQAYSDIDLWKASALLSDAKTGAWTKIRIYDTTKPDHPLFMDIEKKDSAQTNIVLQVNDSAKIDISAEINDSIAHENDLDNTIIKDQEVIAEERVSDMWRDTAKIGFCILLLYGMFYQKSSHNG